MSQSEFKNEVKKKTYCVGFNCKGNLSCGTT
jgi:hypothetical protein